MKEEIIKELKESIEVKNKVIKELVPVIEEAAKKIISAYKNNKKVLLFGNGGSAADAQHIATELVVRFKKNRKALAAIALTTDTSLITAAGNDYGFDTIFERQIEALGQKGDVAIGFSTSGQSENVARALKKATEKGLLTIGLLGCEGGKISSLAELAIVIPSNDTARIQEAHITIGHILCNLIEKELFS